MIKGADTDDIIRKLVLAHADNELLSIAVVFVNDKGNVEIEMSFGAGHAYAINTGIDLLKDAVISKIKSAGQIEPRERE
jgi:hypothetical protein